MAAVATMLDSVFPLGTRVNARGRLEVGGCDLLELAQTYGTPSYVVAEDDLRARARAFRAAADASGLDVAVVYASKAFPCTAVLRLFAQEGLWVDVASGGELHLALHAGVPAERLVVHGNAKSTAELQQALGCGAGVIVIDNHDELDRLAALTGPSGSEQPVMLRVAPDVRGETHAKISTGQADTKFGFSVAQVPGAIDRVRATPGLRLRGLHAHIGSQLMDLRPFAQAASALGRLPRLECYDLGGGLGVAYTPEHEPPSIEAYVDAVTSAAREHLSGPAGEPPALLIEPGRSLVANAGVTLYRVESVKRNVSKWVAVDGGMSDNLRPMLYGSPYMARIVDRPDQEGELCHLAGKHCESGDVIVRDARLPDPRPGDVVVTPATGAYGHALANNYNGVPRPPVILVAAGRAEVVVRRETFADLTARDAGGQAPAE